MKHASRLFSLLVLTAAFVGLTGVACDQSAPDRVWERGFFMPMSENIQSYSMPSGVSIDSCYGNDDEIPESYMPLYLVVSNANSGDTKVTFPAGLVFSPNIADYQYMMILKDFSFTATGGGTSSAIVPTYGCNEEELDAPDDESFYSIAGREWDKETQELLDIVAPKALNTDDAVELAQEALSEITDGDGLTDSTKTKLNALP
ncbi:hypothetical protein JXD38_00065 [candidate division WOR-3 bacterium]|nr:hypothetical protein [candidate division WOR-3 bacterium]